MSDALGVPNIFTIAAPLIDAMQDHPEFSVGYNRYFCSKQLVIGPQDQAINLLRFSIRQGSPDAVAWYHRVLKTEKTNLELAGRVLGLAVSSSHRFSNGVSFRDLAELPDTENFNALKVDGAKWSIDRTSVASIDIGAADGGSVYDNGIERVSNAKEQLRATVNSLSLSEKCNPIVAETWINFLDPDLQAAEYFRIWSRSETEGSLPLGGLTLSWREVHWVEKFLQCPKEVMDACKIPLERLNTARRRLSAGDKALDGAICLETLLSGQGSGELTHKVSVRTALLLGKSLNERKEIRKRVRDFYSLRSAVVHGSTKRKRPDDDRRTAEDGLELCLAVLRAVIENKTAPAPEEWELTGGPPWNRFNSITP
ncbi:hypothetical protein IFT66_14700 [Rhizobium sp. CFBP 13726]|uniref:HEPN domain-containing protein n=1 Tax=Rhizobium sp. CFBP 13726 TaxID=2775296 RepID=UPI0017844AE6|nr:HEPN domain-containing protein [Rhizobium sp. CFBP 13726]MBD8652335.1 hypothetical protein [Rhizobium sp. CFBP 13726]